MSKCSGAVPFGFAQAHDVALIEHPDLLVYLGLVTLQGSGYGSFGNNVGVLCPPLLQVCFADHARPLGNLAESEFWRSRVLSLANNQAWTKDDSVFKTKLLDGFFQLALHFWVCEHAGWIGAA